MKPVRVSVVIPLLDSPVLGETLEALAAQGAPGPEREVVIVGRDGFRQVPLDGGVRFLETDGPCTPAEARNRGVEAAAGDLLLFTDADCRPLPGWVDRLVESLGRVPVAGGAVTFPHDSDRWALADNIASFNELLDDRPGELDSKRPLGSLNLAVRREAWERVGPFAEELATSEDFDWVLRARHAGLATAFVPGALVEHAAVRQGREALERHARWYGRHFHAFCRRHPGVFAQGPTWRSRRRLAGTAALKSLHAAIQVFLSHPRLWRCWRALPGVVRFKRAWYGAVLETWDESGRP